MTVRRMKTPEVCMVYFDAGWMRHERHLAECFRDMKDMGADSVFTQFVEHNDLRWLTYRTNLAHETGLKVYASPGRIAGMFAAGPVPGSFFATQYRDTTIRDQKGEMIIDTSGLVCCVNNPDFQKWYYPFMEKTLLESGADGIAFDEPKATSVPCWCSHCQAMVDKPSPESLQALRQESMARMLGQVCTMMKRHRPGFVTIAMLMPGAATRFVELVAREKDMDFIGVDGPLCRQGPVPAPDLSKTPLWESAPRFQAIARAAGKKLFVLAETFNVNPWACDELEARLPELKKISADMYAFNYYGHDNDDPEAVMRLVRKAAKMVVKTNAAQ